MHLYKNIYRWFSLTKSSYQRALKVNSSKGIGEKQNSKSCLTRSQSDFFPWPTHREVLNPEVGTSALPQGMGKKISNAQGGKRTPLLILHALTPQPMKAEDPYNTEGGKCSSPIEGVLVVKGGVNPTDFSLSVLLPLGSDTELKR